VSGMETRPSKAVRVGRLNRFRVFSALFVLLLVSGISVAGFLAERGVEIPSFIPTCLHGICPLGGVVTIGRLLENGLFIPRTGIFSLFALAAGTLTTLLFGAFFCGWLCPLGAVQEWVRKLGKRIGIFPKSTGIPYRGASAGRTVLRADRILGHARYLLLGAILYMTYRSFNLVFASIDPYYALFHFWTGSAMPAALTLLALILAVSLFVYRPWCRWFCPFGAVQGLLQKIAPWKIRRDENLCIHCGACAKVCPAHIAVDIQTAVRDGRCNRCLSCTAVCPVEGALTLKTKPAPGRRIQASKYFFSDAAGIAALVIAGFLLPLSAGGLYRTMAGTMAESGAAGTPTAATVPVNVPTESSVHLTVLESLSSALTLEETSHLLKMETGVFLQALSLPPAFDPAVKLRDVETYMEEKTYRWIRRRIENLLENGIEEFTKSSPPLPDSATEVLYPADNTHSTGGMI
jgi:ferredoxin